MIDTLFTNLKPLNFAPFNYEPLPFKYTSASSFSELPESAKACLSIPSYEGRVLGDVRDEWVNNLFGSINDIQVAIAGGLLQIHLPDPEKPLDNAWVEDLERVVYQNYRQEYFTLLDTFVESFDALLWNAMRQQETTTGNKIGEEEMQRRRDQELKPYLDEVYKRLLKTWSEACGEQFKRRSDDVWEWASVAL